MLTAGAVILAGGVWLARRTEARRISTVRPLLRECAATLQGELSRLDQLFYAHLRQVSEVLATGTIGERVQAEADRLHGIASVSLLPRKGAWVAA